jgi:MFS family permease
MWLKAQKTAGETQPLRELFSGTNARALGQVFIVMTGAWLTLNAVAGAVPGVLKTTMGVSAGWTNIVVLVGALVGVVLFPLFGVLGQRYGRRQILIALGVVNIVVTPPLYAMAVASGGDDLLTLVLLLGVVQIATLVIWSIVTAYITESFPTSVRASGYGIGYSLASIIPAFYAFYMLGLGTFMPYEYTQIVVLALGGVCLAVGAFLGKDQRHKELG